MRNEIGFSSYTRCPLCNFCIAKSAQKFFESYSRTCNAKSPRRAIGLTGSAGWRMFDFCIKEDGRSRGERPSEDRRGSNSSGLLRATSRVRLLGSCHASRTAGEPLNLQTRFPNSAMSTAAPGCRIHERALPSGSVRW